MKLSTSSLTGICRRTYGLCAALAILSLTTISLTANAQDSWTGAVSGTWTNTGNWLSGTAPISTDTVSFDSNSTANLSTSLGGAFTINGISNTSGKAVSIAAGTGGSLTIGAGGISVTGAGSTLTLNTAITLSANQTWSGTTSATALIFGSAAAINLGGYTLTLNLEPGVTTVEQNGSSISNGTMILNSGTLQSTIPSGFGIGSTATLQLNSGAAIIYNGTGTGVASGTIALNGGQVQLYMGNPGGNNSISPTAITVSASGGAIARVGGYVGTSTVSSAIRGIAGSGTTAALTLYTLASTQTLVISGPISDGTAGGALAVTATSAPATAGVVTLSGSNSYSGGTTLAAGTLVVTNSSSVGTGAFTMDDSTILAAATGSSVTLTGVVLQGSAARSFTFGNTSYTGNLTLLGVSGTGSIDGGDTNNKTFTVQNTTTLGLLTGANASDIYTVSGTGTLILSASNTLQQSWLVSASSTLLANSASSGAGTVTVNAGGTLGGNGTVGNSAIVNGTITAGATVGSIGTLKVNGALILNSTAAYKLTLNSTTTTADLVAVTGNLTLGGTLSGTDLGSSTLANGTKLSIMTYAGSLSGAFSNAADGSTITIGTNTYVLNYGLAGDSGNTGYVSDAITLTVVPEPSTVVLACIFGTGMLLLFRRRLSNSESR